VPRYYSQKLKCPQRMFDRYWKRTMKTPIELTADFTYLRFHGPSSAKYSGSYSDRELQKWAGQINEWRKRLSDIYVYFNNDVGGWAVRNATDLKRMVLSR
jgi:uncharacterized protein YecE (DUF72 family)